MAKMRTQSGKLMTLMLMLIIMLVVSSRGVTKIHAIISPGVEPTEEGGDTPTLGDGFQSHNDGIDDADNTYFGDTIVYPYTLTSDSDNLQGLYSFDDSILIQPKLTFEEYITPIKDLVGQQSRFVMNQNEVKNTFFENFYPDLKWYMYPGTTMRTISLTCPKGWYDPGEDLPNGSVFNFNSLMDLVDEYCDAGVTVLQLNSVYDPGTCYDPTSLWCGLAVGDFFKFNPIIENYENWIKLYKKAKTCWNGEMKLMSWLNPSYIWTGSIYYQMAMLDLLRFRGKLDELYSDEYYSPANWFWWYGDAQCTRYPDCDIPEEVIQEGPLNGYVYDEGLSDYLQGLVEPGEQIDLVTYMTIWARQPSAKISSPQYQEFLEIVLDYFVNKLGLDGVTLDAPHLYISAGSDNSVYSCGTDSEAPLWEYEPDLMKEAITDVVSQKFGINNFAFFAEEYGRAAPDDASFNHYACILAGNAIDTDYPAAGAEDQSVYEVLWYSVAYGDITNIDYAFFSPGGADAVIAQCYFTNGDWCPVAWMRSAPAQDKDNQNPPRLDVDGKMYERIGLVNALTAVIASAGGYIPNVEIVSPQDYIDEGTAFWSAANYPGMQYYNNDFRDEIMLKREFQALSLRTRIYGDNDAIYSLIRYDAFGGGFAGFFSANVLDSDQQVTLDLSEFEVIEDRFGTIYGQDGQQLPYNPIDIGAYGWSVQPSYQLPAWTNLGKVNCYNYDGYNELDDGYEMTSLGACLLHCMGDPEYICEAVTVEWLEDGFVKCYKRNNIFATNCDDSDAYSTFYLSNTFGTIQGPDSDFAPGDDR